MNTSRRLGDDGLVLALGGGGAAGLAHVGVLQALAEHGIPVRAIAGTSIGAEIGAFVAAGMPVQDLAALSTSIDWKQGLQLFLPDLPTGGLISGVNIVEFLKAGLGARHIEDLAVGYVAVAADLVRGEQVVLDDGDLVEAVRASISVPGVLAPVQIGDRWLVDGGVVNPVPFDVARVRFGGPVLAVPVHGADTGITKSELLSVGSPAERKRLYRVLARKLEHELACFSGTEEWYRHGGFWRHEILLTEGVMHLAENGGRNSGTAFWLIDAIASYQGEKVLAGHPFQVWKLIITEAEGRQTGWHEREQRQTKRRTRN